MRHLSDKFDEFIEKVDNGSSFFVDFRKKEIRLNGKAVEFDDFKESGAEKEILETIEELYHEYKYSVPSIRSSGRRRKRFKALGEEHLSDEELIFGTSRETAQAKLESYVVLVIKNGNLKWNDSWGNWFWQSSNDKDLVIFKDWFKEEKTEEAQV